MEIFKKADFLEVGKVYADISGHEEYTTYLRFVGAEDGRLLFDHFSGRNSYGPNQDGLICFPAEYEETSPSVFSYVNVSPFFIPNKIPSK